MGATGFGVLRRANKDRKPGRFPYSSAELLAANQEELIQERERAPCGLLILVTQNQVEVHAGPKNILAG